MKERIDELFEELDTKGSVIVNDGDEAFNLVQFSMDFYEVSSEGVPDEDGKWKVQKV